MAGVTKKRLDPETLALAKLIREGEAIERELAQALTREEKLDVIRRLDEKERELELVRVSMRTNAEIRALAARAHEDEHAFDAYVEALVRAGRYGDVVRLAGPEIDRLTKAGVRASEPRLRALVENHNLARSRAPTTTPSAPTPKKRRSA